MSERSESPEREPILFLDVNLGKGKSARIVLYEGDTPGDVINSFGQEHNLNEKKRSKLLDAVNSQLNQLLEQDDKSQELEEIREKPNEETEQAEFS